MQTLQKISFSDIKISFSEKSEIFPFLESKGFIEKKENVFYGKNIFRQIGSFDRVPDLIVIDGGKGQLSSVWEILKKSDYKDEIFLCSLAKREEEIFLIQKEEGEFKIQNFKFKILKDSQEGYLLQKIRDEAHRFAIGKNRAGREKNAQKSVLDEIKGVGSKTKKILKEKFGGVAGIRNASDDDLLKYISPKILQAIREKV